MASTAKIKLQFNYTDDSTRDLEISPLDPTSAAILNAKTNIKAFDTAAVASSFISEGGASCTGIGAATIVKVTENEINLNVSE